MSRYRKPADINSIVIHCSGTPNGRPLRAVEIDRWHRKRGFYRALEARLGEGDWPLYSMHQPHLGAIGYHFVIGVNGVTETGRRLTETGAHALDPRYPKGHRLRGRWNRDAAAICLVGTDAFSEEQWSTLGELVRGLKADKRYNIKQIIGHRDLSPDSNRNGIVDEHEWIKICPGFGVGEWLAGGMRPLDPHVLNLEN